MIKRFQAEKYIFTVQGSEGKRKAFQVIFSRSDGSLFVNFPYFKHVTGLASVVTFSRNSRILADLSLEPGGKVTSSLVKYAHHPDGRAHFSQSGRVMSTVRKRAVPLLTAEGHIFTIQLQGLSCFDFSDNKDNCLPSSGRTVLNFSFKNQQPDAVKFVGRWYSVYKLSQRIVGNVEGPIIVGKTPSGKSVLGFLIGPPIMAATSEYVLMVSCENIPLFDRTQKSALTFIGGFDDLSVVNNLSRDTTFLALSYPVTNYAELKAKIGSIDLNEIK